MNQNNLLPSNLEAEEALLGGLLLDDTAINRIAHLTIADHFLLSSHQLIYKTVLKLHKEGQPSDLMSVTTRLANIDKLEAVGGTNKLSQLVNRTVSAINIDRYALLLKQKYRRRKLIELGNMLVNLGYSQDVNDEELNGLVKRLTKDWIEPSSKNKVTDQPIEVNYQRFISSPDTIIQQCDRTQKEKPIISESLSLKTVANSFEDIDSLVVHLKEKAKDCLDQVNNSNSDQKTN